MIVRKLNPKDYAEVEEIHSRHHKFPCPDLSRNVGSVVIQDSRGIIGAGILKPIVESIMILDLSRSRKDKNIALRYMIQEAVRQGQEAGQVQIHAYVEDIQFQRVLIKHYDFSDPKGRALVLEI